MTSDTDLLREIRDLLQVIAEPALAQRDQRVRQGLANVVGNSKAKAKAVLLMDGSRTQVDIKKESGIDFGALSRCVKELRAAGIIHLDEDKRPKLLVSIPPNFFETKAEAA